MYAIRSYYDDSAESAPRTPVDVGRLILEHYGIPASNLGDM